MLNCTRRGNTKLHEAVLENRKDIVEYLVFELNVNSTNKGRYSALHLAVWTGNKGIIEVLLQYGADPTLQSDDGETSLHIACTKPAVDVVYLLLYYGWDLEYRSFYKSCLNSRRYNENILVDLKSKADLNLRDKSGCAPLHVAAMNGHAEIIEVLLRFGADINCVDENHFTALHRAVLNQHQDAVTVLLEHGSDVNAVDDNGQTPIHLAAEDDNVDFVNQFLDEDNDPDLYVCNTFKETAFHIAVQNGCMEIVTAFLRKGFNFFHPTCWEKTPLNYAIFYCQYEMMKFLINRGAQLNAHSFSHYTPEYMEDLCDGEINIIRYIMKCVVCRRAVGKMVSPGIFRTFKEHEHLFNMHKEFVMFLESLKKIKIDGTRITYYDFAVKGLKNWVIYVKNPRITSHFENKVFDCEMTELFVKENYEKAVHRRKLIVRADEIFEAIMGIFTDLPYSFRMLMFSFMSTEALEFIQKYG